MVWDFCLWIVGEHNDSALYCHAVCLVYSVTSVAIPKHYIWGESSAWPLLEQVPANLFWCSWETVKINKPFQSRASVRNGSCL